MSSPVLTKASKLSEKNADEIYDVRDTPEEPFIVWWNDIEKDSRYKEWSSDIYEVKIVYYRRKKMRVS